MKLIDLGFSIGRLTKRLPGVDYGESLCIVAPSWCDSEGYIPAQSITIHGEKNLIALRDALNETFPPEAAK